MIVLDTNVVSELMNPKGSIGVLPWINDQPAGKIYVTAVTAAELCHGVARLPDGRRKTDLAERLQRVLEVAFRGRVLPFDDKAALCYADVVVNRTRQGLAVGMADAQIAAICRSHTARVATRNVKDFLHPGIDIIDPWQESAN